MRVTVLSKDYEPLTYCDVKKAVTLLYLNKAEAVKNSNLFIRTISKAFQIPLVIRLLYKTVKKFIPGIKYSRKSIHNRDNHTCQYCGSTRSLSIDHILPVSRGGLSTWENTVTACQPCNSKKGNKTPQEANMILMSIPKKPDMSKEIDWNEIFSEN